MSLSSSLFTGTSGLKNMGNALQVTGIFLFNKDGQLVNPEGYVVQGWELDSETGDDIGAINDIVLQAFTNPPKKSTQITAVTNLDADAASKSVVLSNNWDSSEDTYMKSTNYEYQTVLKVYDALGSTHDVSVFYDKKSGTEWEYIITCNPEEDKRNMVQGTDAQGLLARGTITFSQSSGDILDLTMSEFTGRLGNFQANGVNTNDAIHYEILNSEELAQDGYGFAFEFNGSAWNFVDANNNGIIENSEKPANYPNATIVYSDNQEVHLVLNQQSPTQTDPDLKIKFDQPAVATDSFGFDINDPNNIHVQGIEGTRYFGDTANDNTTLEINDPSVMTHDSKGLGIVWNPNVGSTGKWYWSNPDLANSAGTLVSGVAMTNSTGGTLATTAATMVVNNAEDMGMVAQNIKMRYDGTQWDWNDGVKIEDFTSTYTFVPTNDPVISVQSAGSEGSIATDTAGATPTLHWIGTQWSLSSAGPLPNSAAVGNATIAIDTAASSSTNVVFDIWYNDSAGESTIEYTFGAAMTTADGQSIAFMMDPTPPQE
ncbi:MAG: hypothetical protein HUK40_15210 [Desulfobacter sp.]|nr:hypothetical protein [Desulfobacter sp.]